MGAFDIVGPIMIGPSSSHTAGACRLGKMASTILGEKPVKALITLHGSFAKTHKGHGTDKALIAGLLGLQADDAGIKNSFALARETQMEFTFSFAESGECHPNTTEFELQGASGKTVKVIGASVGGGSIVISKIDGYDVECTGEYQTLIAVYQDKPGVIAMITQILGLQGVNIATMRVSRKQKGSQALMVIETDQLITGSIMDTIRTLPGIESAILVQPL